MLDQHRQRFTLNALQLQACNRRFFGTRVNGDPAGVAYAAFADVAGVGVYLDANQIVQVAHQTLCFGGNAAPALGLKSAYQYVRLVGCGGKALQAQIKLHIAFVIGFCVAQFVGQLFLGAHRIIKTVVGMAAKAGVCGGECQNAFDPALLRRRAKQVLHVDGSLQVTGFDPAFQRFGAQAGRYLGPIRQKLLHFYAGGPQQQGVYVRRARRAGAGQEKIDHVVAGRRAVLRTVLQLRRATGAQPQRFAANA